MNNHLVYMISIDSHMSRHKHSIWSVYAINTWEYWCNKHGVDFYVETENDSRFTRPIWNKHLIFEKFGNKYDKIGIVDSDTMIRWNAPDIFEEYDDEFCGVLERDNLYWVNNSINAYQKFFPETKMNLDTYINAGVTFFTNKHKPIYDRMLEFYLSNKEELENWTIPDTGREQTPFNFVLQELNIKKKILPPCWNCFGMIRKDYLIQTQQGMSVSMNWQLKEDATPFFIKYNYIWHFTSMPIEMRQELMKMTWEAVKENYK